MKQKTIQIFSLGTMVLIMSFVVVLVSTFINFGITEDFLWRLLRSWGLAYLLAFPLALVLMPRLQKFYMKFLDKP